MPVPAADLLALSRLFDEASALDGEQRARWLANLPDGQRRLMPALRTMLERGERGSSLDFLDALPALDDDAPPEHGVPRSGDLVGRYRLVRGIGHGGMGTVWLAERADGAMERRVALKLPRLTCAPGLAKRMAQERDIGAMLEHPAIARLYDAAHRPDLQGDQRLGVR